MPGEIKLSVVLPAYREEENLKVLLPGLKKTLTELAVPCEILVVDSLSALDGTREVCLANGVRYANRDRGDFFGDAVRTGIALARGEQIVFMDADGSHPPEFVRRLYEHGKDSDIVIASRYVAGGGTENPRLLIAMSRVLNFIYSAALGINCRDISNSFKLYRAGLLKPLELRCDNFDIVEEILFKICRRNRDVKIKELPFVFEKRKFGKTKRNLPAFMLSFLFTLLKLRFGK